jgi:hypothetical protein
VELIFSFREKTKDIIYSNWELKPVRFSLSAKKALFAGRTKMGD